MIVVIYVHVCIQAIEILAVLKVSKFVSKFGSPLRREYRMDNYDRLNREVKALMYLY